MTPVWASYRAPCIPMTTGCRQCGKEISARRAYCSDACRSTFEANHFWPSAAFEARRRARNSRGEPVCARCGKECGRIQWFSRSRREEEVNHKLPLNGARPTFGCCHHQENLEVLCHDCHVAVGKEQRAAGLIGKNGKSSAVGLAA